jgi:hypothetical protein
MFASCASSTIAAISPSSSTSKLPRVSPGLTSTRSISARVISSASSRVVGSAKGLMQRRDLPGIEFGEIGMEPWGRGSRLGQLLT